MWDVRAAESPGIVVQPCCGVAKGSLWGKIYAWGSARQLSGQRCLRADLMIWVRSLHPTWWQERNDCCLLSSDLHILESVLLGHIPGYLINTQIEAKHIVHKFIPHLWWWRLKPREKVWATEQHYDEQVLPQATSCLGYPFALPSTPLVSRKTFPYLWWHLWPIGLYWLPPYELALAVGSRMTLWPVLATMKWV